jgi:hypothetical protein
MSKAVLVMNMPECCADCPCSFFERDNPILNLICGVTQEDAYNVGKPDWCPLRELPEKKERRIGEHGERMFRAGFNACLNEIMRQGMSDSVD